MARTRLSRAQLVAANDVALRRATADMALESGWDAITFSGIAKRAGLTVGAIYGRVENSAELGIDLWQHSVEPWLTEAVASLTTAGRLGDPRAMLREVTRWEREETAALAVELLVASLFDADLGEVIAPEALASLTPWCLPVTTNHRTTKPQAAAGVLTTSFAFGRALAQRAGVRLPKVGTEEAAVLVGHHNPTGAQPRCPAPRPLEWVSPVIDDDAASQAVVRGTLEVVGRVGYKRATIARIARHSGVPRGSILRQVPDKAALVARSAQLGLIAPGAVWSQYKPVVDKYGPLLARAIFLREFLKPQNRPLWAVNLELARMSRFIPELRDFCPGDSVLEQTHLGVMLTACLVPGIAELPYRGPFTAGSTT